MSDVVYKKPRSGSITEMHPKVLGLLQDYLVRTINFDSLHDQLISSEAFDEVDLADMKEEPKRSGKIRELLQQLKKSDKETYAIFKRCLQNTKQGHIVVQLELEEERVSPELKLDASDKTISLKKAHSQKGTRSNPLDVPSSPIAQPVSSLHGSPGNPIQDLREKFKDED